MKAIQANTDARDCSIKNMPVFSGDRCNVISFRGGRKVGFFSSFLPISHSEFLKGNLNCDTFSHSENFYANRVGNECKKHKSHQKTISPLCALFRFRSEFSYRNYDEHIDLQTTFFNDR